MDSFEKVLPKILKLQLFADFSDSDPTDIEILKSVYDILEIKTFKKDEVIIREGETGSLFYILYSGQV